MGGGENRALATEEGRDISDQLESITGSYEKGVSNDTYNGNFNFHFKNGTIIKPGDYIELLSENLTFPNNTDILLDDKKIGKLEVKELEHIITLFRKFNNNEINSSDLEKIQPFQGRNKRVRITFDKINEPTKVNNFNLFWNNMYSISSQSSSPKNMRVSISTKTKEVFSQNFLHDKFGEIKARKDNIFSNGINLYYNKDKKLLSESSPYSIIGQLQKGDRIKLTLNPDGKVYFKNTIKENDELYGGIQELTFLDSRTVKLNQNDVYIPIEKTISYPKFKVVKRTPYETELEYIGEDMKVPQTSMIELNSTVKKEHRSSLNKAVNEQFYHIHYKLERNGEILKDKEDDENVYIKGVGATFSGIPVDPTYQLTVRYLDENGQQLSNSDKIINENGNDYNISPKDIPKYTFKSANKSLKGNLTEDTTIDLIYSKKQSDLTIKHIDIDTGEEIKDKIIEKKNIDDNYTITPAQINMTM